MMPSDHMLYGFIAALIILFLFPSIGAYGLLVIFLASVLIDADHYLYYVYKTRDFNLSNAMSFYLEIGKKQCSSKKSAKEPLMIFHTAEFWLLLFILSFFNEVFAYVLAGVLIHVFLDIFHMRKYGVLHVRHHSILRYCFYHRRLSVL